MTSWHVGDLPFVFTIQHAPGNCGLPEFLPFSLTVDEDVGFYAQTFDVRVAAALEWAYAHGSELSGLMDEEGLGRKYADDYLGFLVQSCPILEGDRILDVGCGTGYLVSRMRSFGADVPRYSVVAGVPAVVLRRRSTNAEQRTRRKRDT